MNVMMRSLHLKNSCLLLLLLLLHAPSPVFAQAEPEAENPIGKFFRNLNKDVREEAEEIQKAKQGRDQLDARPPQNPDLSRRLEQAKKFLQQERWEDAISVLQFLIETETDYFFFDKDLELRSLHTEVQRLLEDLSDDAVRNYLNRFESTAQRELEFGREFQDDALLSRLANTFMRTPAGRKAAYTYAMSLYDQGQFRAAGDVFVVLANQSEAGAVSQRYAGMAARVAALQGDQDLLNQLITEFDLPPEIREPSFQYERNRFSDLSSTQLVQPAAELPTEVHPQFIPVWTHQSVDSYLAEDQIQRLFGDLAEANRAVILSSQCILQGELIAYQTLNGLEVRNAKSGELVWEDRSRRSVQSALTDPEQSQIYDAVYRGRVPEQHPVVSLLLRDGISRSLTTDGRHLFAIAKHQLLSNPTQGYSWQRRMLADSPDDEKYETNEVVAYDFATGRVRWRLGGKVLEEPFSRPLAGTFFFGPPVSDGSDLCVIGEKDDIISLYVLNAQTGEVLWSQEIAHPSRSLSNDQVRRHWPCYPAIQDGVIVCPTTCGWLVAVDQASHQLMWATRYTPRKQSRRTRSFAVQAVQELNKRWASAPPVIVGDRVLFTPQELPNEFNKEVMASYCFDLTTGSLLWQQDKQDGLYLVGIFEDSAIFVGQSNVIARKISGNGELVWSTNIGGTNGKPSGRSVIVNNELLVPVNGDTIVQIDLTEGKILHTHRLESSEIELGSLYQHDKLLFSLSTFHTSAFPIEKLSAEQLDQLAKSFSAELISIEYLISNQKYSGALDAIQELRSRTYFQQATSEQRENIEELEWSCMEQLVLSESTLAEETLFAMQTLAETPAEIARYQRLAATQETQNGKWSLALRHLLMLLQNSSKQQFFSDGTRTVRADVWVAGQMIEIYNRLDEAGQLEFLEMLRTEEGPIKKNIGLHRFAQVFCFLPTGEREQLQLALVAAQSGRHTEAITRFQRATNYSQSANTVEAWLGMADAFVERAAYSDARNCLKQVMSLESVDLPGGEDSHGYAKTQLAKIDSMGTLENVANWGDTWEAFRTGSQRNDFTLKSITTIGLPFEFQRNHRHLFQQQNERLFIEQAHSGEYAWSLPLRSMTNINHRSNVGILQTGAVTYAVHQGVVHALYPLDQKTAWTFLPEVTGSSLTRLRSPSSRSSSVVNNLTSFRNIVNLDGASSQTGILLDANEFCVLVFDEALHALDPFTGELLWSESEVDQRTTVRMLADQVLLCEQGKSQLRRACDGKDMQVELDPEFQVECLDIYGDRCLYLIEGEESTDSWTLSRGTLQDKSFDWRIELEAESLLVKFDETNFSYIAPDGEIFLIDMIEGSQKSIGFVPGDLMEISKRFYAYQDRDHVFLAVAHGEGRTSYVSLQSLRASGTLLCFSKEEGLIWSQNTEELAEAYSHQPAKTDDAEEDEKEAVAARKTVWSMNLIVQDIEESPLLLFISDRPEHRNKIYFRRLTMIGLDKNTGEPVFDWYRISNSGGFSYLHVDVRDRHLELRTYNERLKIQPVQRQQANLSAGDE